MIIVMRDLLLQGCEWKNNRVSIYYLSNECKDIFDSNILILFVLNLKNQQIIKFKVNIFNY